MVKRAALFTLIFSLALCASFAGEDLFPDRGFRFGSRTFELGFNTGIGLYNNMITLDHFTREKMVIDIDAFNALVINTDIDITPFYFMINIKDDWGFGLSINTDIVGNAGLSENLISLNPAKDEKSDSGFAVFADASIDVFFHVNYFKVKVRPSVYYTVAYSKPDITYSFITDGYPVIKFEYETRIYSALNIDNIDNIEFSLDPISGKPGVDFSFGIEYPLARATEIYKQFALFDFDVGIDFINIPIVPSSLSHYMKMIGELTMEGETIEDFTGSLNADKLSSDITYGEEEILITRPFRTNIYANWRPFGSKVFIIIPNIGFSVNPMFLDPFSPEGGLYAKMDLANILILTLGANYEDRVWKYNACIDLNLRVLELNIGAEVRTAGLFDFINLSGAGIYLGVRFGF